MFHVATEEEIKVGRVADGKVVSDIPRPQEIREYVLNQLQHFSL